MNIERILSEADPARNVPEDELTASRRRAFAQATTDGAVHSLNDGAVITDSRKKPGVSAASPSPLFARLAAAAIAVIAIVALGVTATLFPRPGVDVAENTLAVEKLFQEAAAVVAGTPLSAQSQGGANSETLRFQLEVDVQQVLKGGIPTQSVLFDVTGHPAVNADTIGEANSGSLYKRAQLFFLDGTNKLVESPLAMLTVTNKRTGAVVDSSGDPVALPEQLRNQLTLLPVTEVPLETSGMGAGQAVDGEVLGRVPGAAQEDPVLGVIQGEVGEEGACFWYEFEGQRWYLVWPEGFTAHVADLPRTFMGNGPTPMVLNEAGYPYVVSGFPTPFIEGRTRPGEESTCNGLSMPVAEIAVESNSTLLRF
ncbi:hypothetical protein BJ994_000276 [Arthrobacter pigmenti]|uniref:Uncharacterized protein n=1 Tax=Arthrobacter pigmenti TaxID=271432 RepID=A0A846RHM4_9MICC|nr:hypothetical protein [Arthrobacter pigmenti]NJC21200.1 hypothetical protein [Arthrobacter pigmenti]